MMNGAVNIGAVKVVTTQGRGASVEELADRALDKIISVGDTSHPLVRAQAHAYREDIRKVLEYYLAQAIKAEHTNVRNRLRNAGCPEITSVALGE